MTKRFRIFAARLLIPLFLLGIVPQRPAHAILPFFVPLVVSGLGSSGAVSFTSIAGTVASALIGGAILALAITPSVADAPTGSAVRVATTDVNSNDLIPAPYVANPPPDQSRIACWRATASDLAYFGWDNTCYSDVHLMCEAYGGHYPEGGPCELQLWSDETNSSYTRDVLPEVGSNGLAPSYTCPDGYRFLLTHCAYDTRLAVSDNKVDVTRYGTTMTVQSDIDSSNQYLRPATISVNGGTNNAIAVSGTSEAGEPRRVVVEATTGGGSRVVIQDQKADAAGNTYISNQTIIIDRGGSVTGVSTHATAESLTTNTATDTATGAATTTYTVSTNPATTYSPAVVGSGATAGTGTGTQSITFPSDYARAGESQSAANSTNTKIDSMKTDLLKVAPAPSDPTLPEWSFFPDTFSPLRGWSLPSHTSQCPTGSFSAFGNVYSMDTQCNLIVSYWSQLSAAMQVVWVILALFIVLAA